VIIVNVYINKTSGWQFCLLCRQAVFFIVGEGESRGEGGDLFVMDSVNFSKICKNLMIV